MKVTPVLDNVLVELDPFESTFGDGPIIRPDIAMEKPMDGTVLAVGRGRISDKGVRIPVELSAGDRVKVPWSTGHDLGIGGWLHVMVKADDILTVEEPEDAGE